MTGWNVTATAARAGSAFGIHRGWLRRYSVSQAQGLAQRGERSGGDHVFARVYKRNLATASAADRKALEAARASVDGAVIERAVASGAPISAVAELAAAWPKLPATAQAVIRYPVGQTVGTVRLGAARAIQVDQTTCGAAVMSMMLMMADPLVAAWVMTGRHFGNYLPPEIVSLTLAPDVPRTIEERWNALQRALHAQVTRRGVLGVVPWPRMYGTPPWRINNELRYAGLKFRGAILDDTDPIAVDAVVAHASAALRDGIPVPLFTGGDSHGGVAHTVPRHVVLIVARTDDGFWVYEPSTGRVLPLAESRLLGGGPKEPAFGHWTRACWLVLPRQRRDG